MTYDVTIFLNTVEYFLHLKLELEFHSTIIWCKLHVLYSKQFKEFLIARLNNAALLFHWKVIINRVTLTDRRLSLTFNYFFGNAKTIKQKFDDESR